MKGISSGVVKVEAEVTIYLTIGTFRKRLTREQAESIYADLGMALGKVARIGANGTTPHALVSGEPEWTAEQERQLRVMLRAGRPLENVARAVGHSVDACRKKADEPEHAQMVTA
jgi:hypothetical protein